jgi:non-ribosomal peptide synthetase-like protein
VGESVKATTADLPESSAAEGRYAGPTTGTERLLSEVLADIMGVERVSVHSHFFDDLGADSLVMAHFCARVRKRADLSSVSMKEVYRHPTISSLATAVTDAAPLPASVPASVPASTEVATPTGALQYVLCGALQFLSVLGYFYLAALVFARGYDWISAGSGLIDFYVRSVLVGGVSFLAFCTLPILAKWMLIGRWKPQQIRIWSLGYVRFWVVKTLVRSNPLVLFAGSPIYVLYLRALGAKIGRGVVIFSKHVPVCTDLLTIGDNTIMRKDSFFTCYRAHAGLIQTGPVSLGRDALVGEATVLDIDTSLGDGAQLAHASSLHAGQAIPDGERRHGSSVQQRTEVDYREVGRTNCGTLRRAAYSVVQLLNILVLVLPLSIGGVVMLVSERPQLAGLQGSGSPAFSSWTFYGDALVTSFVLFFGLVLVGLLVVMTVPRVLNLAIKPDTDYPLYGFHYWAHRAIARLTNVTFFPRLLGDSSYIVPYLRCLGYDLSRVEQTGSNFGLEVKHETPYLVSIGSGTMAADGLSIINADYSSTSFRVSRASIGAHSFLGNYVAYPSQGKTGDNCLLATKVMVPVDGEVRERTGLLGSPHFEIPRSVERDGRFDHLKSGDELRRRLAAKNRHNAVTIGLYLLSRWFFVFAVTVVAWGAANLYDAIGAPVIALAYLLVLVFGVLYFSLVERAATAFRALQPRYCSIYDPYFWWHERFWKLAWQPLILGGTPFKGLIWRLLGVRIGRRVFDDGCAIVEKTMVTIGDDCTLNVRSIVQAHSQEDGTFKSDRISIGAGCTLGIGSLVHYGVTMSDGVDLAPDSFLMKGEEVPPHARWGGNPAREIRGDHSAVTTVSGRRSR